MFSNNSSPQMTVVREESAIQALQALYQERREAIQKRLAEFRQVMEWKDEEVFAELCFCLLTPQSSAKVCWEAVTALKERTLLLKGQLQELEQQERRAGTSSRKWTWVRLVSWPIRRLASTSSSAASRTHGSSNPKKKR